MITKEMIKQIAPTSKNEIVDPLIKYLNKYLAKYEVNNFWRVSHFIAQAAHESASFRTLEEYATGAAYEGRKDLGNVNKGDGVRYKGRGIFQLTGRANYRDMSRKLGLDLEGNPELAESPEVSVLTALEYWKSRNLNALADSNDIMGITKKINGGFNGLDDRRKYFARCKEIIPKNISLVAQPEPVPAPKPEPKPEPVKPAVAPTIVVAKVGDKSPYIADLQRMLIRKGAKIDADGSFGPKTEVAVKDFQTKNGLTITGRIDTNTLNKLMV